MFFGDNKDLENLICIKTWGQGFDLVNDKIKLLIPTTRPCESKILIIMISEARVQILFRTEFFGLTCLNTVVLKIPIIVPILSYNSIDSVTYLSFLQLPLESASLGYGTIQDCNTSP